MKANKLSMALTSSLTLANSGPLCSTPLNLAPTAPLIPTRRRVYYVGIPTLAYPTVYSRSWMPLSHLRNYLILLIIYHGTVPMDLMVSRTNFSPTLWFGNLLAPNSIKYSSPLSSMGSCLPPCLTAMLFFSTKRALVIK